MQLVVPHPPGDEVVVENPEVAGEPIVVEPGGIDGLQGPVALDP